MSILDEVKDTVQVYAEKLSFEISKLAEYARRGLHIVLARPQKEIQKVAKVARFKPIHPSEVASVPEAYVKQVGVLKAEVSKLQEKLGKLKKENELLKEKRKLELLNLIEARRKDIVRIKQFEYIKLDFPSLRKKNIAVLSRDMKQLGWFYSFLMGSGEIAVVVSEYPKGKGKKYIVMRGPDLDTLFDFAENIADQIRSGVMVLNRMYDGAYVPPIRVPFAQVPVVALRNGFVCSYCNKRFDTEKDLIQHLKKKHAKLFMGDDEGVTVNA